MTKQETLDAALAKLRKVAAGGNGGVGYRLRLSADEARVAVGHVVDLQARLAQLTGALDRANNRLLDAKSGAKQIREVARAIIKSTENIR